MKKIFPILCFVLLSLAAFSQPGGVTITSTATQVIVTTSGSSKSMPICDFNWAITSGGVAGVADDNLRIWQTDSRDPIPSGQLRFFTIDGVTDNALKDEALGAITSQCNPGAGGSDTLYLADGTMLVNGDTIPVDSANAIPLAPPIDFGGVLASNVQEGLEAIDLRLDTAMVPQATNVYRTWYVNPNGNNVTAVEGDIFKPASNPYWLSRNKIFSGDVINISAGNYVLDSLFTTPYRKNGFAYRDSITVNCLGNVKFSCSSTGTNHTFINDIGSTQYTSDSARIFKLLGNPDLLFTSSAGSSEKALFDFSNANSVATINVGNAVYAGTSNINPIMYFGGRSLSATFDSCSTNGSVIARLGANSVTSIGRNYDLYVKSATTSGGGSSDLGAIRWQGSGGKDSLSNIKIHIGNLKHITAYNGSIYIERPLVKSMLDINIDNISVMVAAGSKINTYTDATETQAAILFATQYLPKGGTVSISIGNIVSPNVVLGDFTSNGRTLDSSIVYIKIKKGLFTRSSPFVINDWILNNKSKLIIDCEDCECSGTQSAFWIDGNTIDATSFIEIRGTYRVVGAIPVVNTRNELVLNNATFINDGSVAAVQSDGAVNVIVKSAFVNAVATDSDVTELNAPIIKNSNVK